MKNFQGKAKQAAEEHNFYDDPGKKLGFRHGFIAGSAWGHEQGFQETVEMLRSKAGAEYFADTGDVLTNQGVADWIQEQLNRGEG